MPGAAGVRILRYHCPPYRERQALARWSILRTNDGPLILVDLVDHAVGTTASSKGARRLPMKRVPDSTGVARLPTAGRVGP